MKTQEEFDTKLDELSQALDEGLQALSNHLATLQTSVNQCVASHAAKSDLQPEFDKAQNMINKIREATKPAPVVVDPPVIGEPTDPSHPSENLSTEENPT